MYVCSVTVYLHKTPCVLGVTAVILVSDLRWFGITYNSSELAVLLYATGDIDPAIRHEVWRFLYGLYPANSTHRWAASGCLMHLTDCAYCVCVVEYG